MLLALLANCVGRFGSMSAMFSRIWARAGKRRQKQNGRGGSSLDVDDSEFVRVEGRAAKAAAAAAAAKAASIEGSQPAAALCWTETAAAPDFAGTSSSSGGGGQLGAPTIRIEQSESPDAGSGRRRESLTAAAAATERAAAGQQQRDSLKMGGNAAAGGGEGGRQQQSGERQIQRIQRMGSSGEKDQGSFSSVELRSHRSGVSGSVPSGSSSTIPAQQQQRPSSSIHGEADLQMCLGKPCARLRLSVQYGEQKKLLILTLHELAQTDELWTAAASSAAGMEGSTGSRNQQDDRTAALQIRLALLTDGQQQPSKVQKFQSKFQPLDQLQVHYGQTFAFDCAKDQLAGSVVRLRLYRKSREQRRPQCLGVAFLRNYLVDAEARKAQNHFLQFRRHLVEPKSAKGSMSLFPSLLSLTHSHHSTSSSTQHQILHHHHPPPPNAPKSPPPPLSSSSAAGGHHPHNPPSAAILPLPNSSSVNSTPSMSCATLATHPHPQQSSAPQSASSSRRGSTVDESGRFCSLPQMGGNQPEVLVSLCYFDVQNRLMVGVDKAAAIGTMGRKEEGHEVFVRITALSPSGVERGKQKSECVRANGAGETQFGIQAYFNIPRNELAQSSVLVHLFYIHGAWPLRRKQRIGQLVLSQQQEGCSSTSPPADAQTHWREMIQGMGITVDKWHMLEGADEIAGGGDG